MAEHHRNPKFLPALDRLIPDPEDRLEAAKQVAMTMQSRGWDLIVQLLEARMTEELKVLVRHELVRSKAEYAARLAEVRGIQLALDAGETVLGVAEVARVELSRKQGTTG